MEEGIDVNNIISEMNYSFVSNTEGCEIQDSEITDFQILDSK